MCRSFLTPAVYCLVERENVEQAEAKLAAYERSNLQDIIHNEARKVQDSTALQLFFNSRNRRTFFWQSCALQACESVYIDITLCEV